MNHAFPHVEIAWAGADRLGETPIWDGATGRLLWIDIRGGIVREWDPDSGAVRAFPFEDLVGGIALAERGRLLVATRKQMGFMDRASGGWKAEITVETDRPDNRFNEARCDPQGRLWIGTMNDVVRQPDGALYRINADLTSTRQVEPVTVPNSLAWSPDGRTLYFADTWRHHIFAFDFDADEGVARRQRMFVDLSAEAGRPDGSVIDADGFLWNVQTGAGCLVRYDPKGRVDRRIAMPTRDVTAACFGGRNCETLFVTSATQKLKPEERAAQPQAGHVFAVHAGVKGLAEPVFGRGR